LASKGIAIS